MQLDFYLLLCYLPIYYDVLTLIINSSQQKQQSVALERLYSRDSREGQWKHERSSETVTEIEIYSMITVKASCILLFLSVVLWFLFGISFSTAVLIMASVAVALKMALQYFISEMKKDENANMFESLKERNERTHM